MNRLQKLAREASRRMERREITPSEYSKVMQLFSLSPEQRKAFDTGKLTVDQATKLFEKK